MNLYSYQQIVPTINPEFTPYTEKYITQAHSIFSKWENDPHTSKKIDAHQHFNMPQKKLDEYFAQKEEEYSKIKNDEEQQKLNKVLTKNRKTIDALLTTYQKFFDVMSNPNTSSYKQFNEYFIMLLAVLLDLGFEPELNNTFIAEFQKRAMYAFILWIADIIPKHFPLEPNFMDSEYIDKHHSFKLFLQTELKIDENLICWTMSGCTASDCFKTIKEFKTSQKFKEFSETSFKSVSEDQVNSLISAVLNADKSKERLLYSWESYIAPIPGPKKEYAQSTDPGKKYGSYHLNNK